MFRLQFLFTIVLTIQIEISAYRILAVYTFPARSHHVVFNVLTNELAKRGHEVVAITADPQNANNENITEIDVKEVSDIWTKGFVNKETASKLKRGVKFTTDMIDSKAAHVMVDMADLVLSNAKVKNLIEDKNQKFDLIIAECLFDFPLVFTEMYKAPFIWFCSFPGIDNNYKVIGAPTSHPFLYPNLYRNRFYNLSIREKLYELLMEIKLAHHHRKLENLEDELVKKHFGPKTSLHELKNNVDLLFVNTNQIFAGNRPVPPSVIYLGGLHLKPVQDLPQDLKMFLDSSKSGVVYISFGTNVRPSLMHANLLDSFINAIEELPYDFIWKFDGELTRKPKNLRIEKWLPQRDLLNHPNIKAFVTQAGLQSSDEAIDSGVPLVGIPMLAEQGLNAERYVQLGIGVCIDVAVMTTEDLIRAIRNVIEDGSYKRNIIQLGTYVRDQPQTPLERAIWWTEHVLKHGTAKHLRSPQANISWVDYLVLDVVLTLLSIVLVCFLFVLLVISLVTKFLRRLLRKDSVLKKYN